MKIQPECMACLLNQMARAYKRFRPGATASEIVAAQKTIMQQVATIASDLSPFYGQKAYRMLGEMLGDADPYRELKQQYNELALRLYPILEQKIQNAPDPLLMAISIAALGNTMDFGTDHPIDVEKDLETVGPEKFAKNNFPAFKAKLASAKLLFIIGDNAGEIVFDRLLIECIHRLHPSLGIAYAVRGGPAINDVTLEDATQVGLNSFCKVVTGSASPGVILEEVSPEFRQLFDHEADVILAKGQGNFESLDEIPTPHADLFFLLKLKCPLVARLFQSPEGSLMFYRRKFVGEFNPA
jgi:uncharacterized protein with ATP-grasp and redox domains